MLRPTWSVFILCAAAMVAVAGASPEKPPLPVVLPATEQELKKVVDSWDKAIKEKNDELLLQTLQEMETLKHESFIPMVRVGLKSTEPKIAAAAYRAAASQEMKDVEKDARKALKSNSGKKDSVVGALGAGAVDYLVRLDFAGEEATVLDELLMPLTKDEKRMKASWAQDMARACIHYLGKYKYKRAVPQLIEMVWEPIPESPNDPKNPPAAYWQARTIVWQASESWARWALKEITAQEFRSAREWKTWFERHKKEYVK